MCCNICQVRFHSIVAENKIPGNVMAAVPRDRSGVTSSENYELSAPTTEL